MRTILLGAAVGVSLSAVPALAGPPMPVFASHEAVYQMTLNSARMSGGVTGASGRMVYRFADTCDGWTVENRTDITFVYADDNPVLTTWEFATWESKDGLRYRFRVRSVRDGAVSEEINGVARLRGPGRGGEAKFTLPEARTLALPKGTVFPTEHTRRLIESAERGDRFFRRTVFDGTDASGAFDVSAAIGRIRPANSNTSPALSKPKVDAALLTAPSWPMQIAFFPLGKQDTVPDYEISLRYYLNGVADEIVQSYGDFTLKGSLETLRSLPKPPC